jgi:DNA-binding response OmpR family regulator
MTENILLADDSKSFSLRLQKLLQGRQLAVFVADTLAELFDQIASRGPFDLIVLGCTVGNISAQSVLDSFGRSNRVEMTPVLMIDSSFIGPHDRLWREIENARQVADQIDKTLGRASVSEPLPLRCGPLIINVENHEVRIQDRLLNLSPTEIQVLYYFAQHVGELVPRDEVLDAVWGNNKTVKSKILDAYMKRLRAVCRAETEDLSFRTVSKMGYQLLLRTPVSSSRK